MTRKIDGHQHFWALERGDYGWLTPAQAPLYRDFGPADLEPLLARAGVDRTVLVQAAPTAAETRYLLELAGRHAFVAGVVGWVDLERPDAPAMLAELAQQPKLVGIRPMLQDIDDPAWITRPELGAAFARLADLGLCFDALVKPLHLPYLLEFLSRHPGLRAVVDHGAKPDIGGGEWQPWADHIAAIGERTSACCKLSGLITEANPTQSWDDLVPYLDHLLAVFGVERLIWGSDWPVLNLAGDYASWRTAFTAWLSDRAADAQDLVDGGNAARFYGLHGKREEDT